MKNKCPKCFGSGYRDGEPVLCDVCQGVGSIEGSSVDELASVVSHPSTFCNSIELGYLKEKADEYYKKLTEKAPQKGIGSHEYNYFIYGLEWLYNRLYPLLNKEQGDAVSDTRNDDSSNADGSIKNEAGNKNTVQSAEEWKVEYDNDTGYNDESFTEYWAVTNSDKSFASKDEKDANWLCALLNQLFKKNK